MRINRFSAMLLQSKLSSSGIFDFHFSIGKRLGLVWTHLIGWGVRKPSCRLSKYASILCIPCICCKKVFTDVFARVLHVMGVRAYGHVVANHMAMGFWLPKRYA